MKIQNKCFRFVDPAGWQTTDGYKLAQILDSSGGALPAGASTSALQGTQQTTLLNQLSALGDIENELVFANASLDNIELSNNNNLINLNELNVRVQSLLDNYKALNFQFTAVDAIASMTDVKTELVNWVSANPSQIILWTKITAVYDPTLASRTYDLLIAWR